MDRALGALARALGLAHRVLPPARPSGTLVLRDAAAARRGVRRSGPGRHQPALGTAARVAARRRGRGQQLCSTLACAGVGLAPVLEQRRHAGRGGRHQRPIAVAGDGGKAAPADDVATLVPLLDGVWSIAREPAEAAASAAPPRSASSNAATSRPPRADAYHHLLRDSLVPRLAKRLEQRLAAEGAGAVIDALRGVEGLPDAVRRHATSMPRRCAPTCWPTGMPSRPAWATPARARPCASTSTACSPAARSARRRGPMQNSWRARASRLTSVPLAQRVLARLHQGDADQGPTALSIDASALAAAQKVLSRASGAPVERGCQRAVRARRPGAAAQREWPTRVRQLEREAPWVLGGAPETALTDAAAARTAGRVDRVAS